MTFEEVLPALKEGKKIKRSIWFEHYYFPDKITVLNIYSIVDFECVWQKEAKSSLSANGKIGGNKLSVEKLFKFSPTNVQ